jgi:hypothetical protein
VKEHKMISALLLGSVLALGPATSRLIPVREPKPIDRTALEGLSFLAQVTATSFKALNPAGHPILLVFSHQGGGVHASVLLAPGDHLESRFPRGTLGGMSLEVVSLDPRDRSTTGALELDALRTEGAQALWVERKDGAPTGRLVAWIVDGTGLSNANSTHVPGPVPIKSQKRERAPRIRRDPLPPL